VSSSHEDIVRANANHYGRLYREHGDTPGAAQWSDEATQDRRLRVLCEIADLGQASVLDFGCGTGRLYQLLFADRFAGDYVGYDVAAELIVAARKKFPSARFECRDIFADGVGDGFDYALVSGVFNNRHSGSNDYIYEILRLLFASVRKGLAFNALSTYVDYFDDQLNYLDPAAMFDFCKTKLSPRVVLRHDYLLKDNVIPYEFSMYVYKAGLPLPTNRAIESGERVD
jgi:SAM-dependent methyltransferase